jgi:23S rRNA (cytidine1920-2'-O)/16S rRNA (cytidine1409-2'-O)-methyltransferase
MGDDRKGGYASRAGLKLAAALDGFELDVTGMRCADLGCHAGGFTDCLLQHGATAVHALDTGYGVLDYRLRTDPRVTVMERTNALHCEPPDTVDLVTIDVGWTKQRHVIPAALQWLGPDGLVITLVKPHYELDETQRRTLLHDGAISHADAGIVVERTVAGFEALGALAIAMLISPLTGAKSTRGGRAGNREYLVLAKKSH